jgi:hypothetical protein
VNNISKDALFFMNWFEKEYPEFVNQYGQVKGFYDQSSDEFQIEEIQDAYVERKKGNEPLPMYFGGSGQFR